MAFNANDNIPSVDQRNEPLIGIVINNKDPLQLRRVQVKIEGLLEGANTSNTPWFKPEPSGICGRTDYGTFDEVPEINSTVQIKLQNGNLRSGTYSANPDTSVDSSQTRLFGEDYPSTSGKCDAKGTWERKNKEQGYEEKLHQSGFYTQIDKGGNLHVFVPGNVYIHVKGGVTVQVDKDFFMKVLGTLGLHGVEDSGISTGANMEILAEKNITVESSFTDINTGVTFGVKESTSLSVEELIPSKVDERHKEVTELQKVVLESGELAKESIETHSKSLLGTRS